MRDACARGLSVAVGGAAHSQSGHALVGGGLVIDTSRLRGAQLRGACVLEAGGGEPWRRVIAFLRGSGLLPPALTDTAHRDGGAPRPVRASAA